MARRRTATLLELAPLSAGAVAEMARECLGVEVLPSGLDGLLTRAEGVPFLVEELLAAAADSGGLTPDGDGWAVRPQAGDVVPRTVADAVAQRVIALDPAVRLVPATRSSWYPGTEPAAPFPRHALDGGRRRLKDGP